MKKLIALVSASLAAIGLVGAFATTAMADPGEIFVVAIDVEVTAPEAGAQPDYDNWSTTALPFYVEPAVEDGTFSIEWLMEDKNEMVKMPAGTQFFADGRYACEISFRVPEAYSISDDTGLYVNGNDAWNAKTTVDPATNIIHMYYEWQLSDTTPPQSNHIDKVSFVFPDLKEGDRLYTEGWSFEVSPAGVLETTGCKWYRLIDPEHGRWEPASGTAQAGETYAIEVETVSFNGYKADRSTEILVDGGSAFFTLGRIVGATHVFATCQWAIPAEPENGDDEPTADEPSNVEPNSNSSSYVKPTATSKGDTSGKSSSSAATGDSSLLFAAAALALLGALGAAFALRRTRS